MDNESAAIFKRMVEICARIESSWFTPERERLIAAWQEIAPEAMRIVAQMRQEQ